MFKKEKKKVEFGIGYINDEYILTFISDFDDPNSVIEKRLSLTAYRSTRSAKALYEYDGYLLTLNELRIKYLSKYYNVKSEA